MVHPASFTFCLPPFGVLPRYRLKSRTSNGLALSRRTIRTVRDHCYADCKRRNHESSLPVPYNVSSHRVAGLDCIRIGNSFMVTTSIALMVHHAFGCWHGDLRLRREWGDVSETTESDLVSGPPWITRHCLIVLLSSLAKLQRLYLTRPGLQHTMLFYCTIVSIHPSMLTLVVLQILHTKSLFVELISG
jgi:hypothetical protein